MSEARAQEIKKVLDDYLRDNPLYEEVYISIINNEVFIAMTIKEQSINLDSSIN